MSVGDKGFRECSNSKPEFGINGYLLGSIIILPYPRSSFIDARLLTSNESITDPNRGVS